MQVVGKGATGPSTRRVSLYDCLERQQAASPPPAATAPAKLGLVQSAAAEEAGNREPVQPAAWHPGTSAGGVATTLADLDPQPDERGQLVTVPGDRLFDTGSSQIKSSAYTILGEIGTVLTQEPERRVLIIGHSDAIGDPDYNRVLSERRARAVRNFMVDNFTIRSDRFSVEGRGEDDPIATNDTQQGRLANRRVEVLFLN
jgi:outer membrane protein OmpA-like peptidoglycan-associated protein